MQTGECRVWVWARHNLESAPDLDFSGVFKAVGSLIKAALKIPLVRAVIQIAACGGPWAIYACLPVTGLMTLVGGGSLEDALKAMAFTAASFGTWSVVGTALSVAQTAYQLSATAFFILKTSVHGVVGGALSLAQGGSFIDGFVSNVVGAAAGLAAASDSAFGPGGTGGATGFIGRTAVAAIAGGTASELTGGKFANGALTAAFAQMWNAEGIRRRPPWLNNAQHRAGVIQAQQMYRDAGWQIVAADVATDVAGFLTPRFYDFLALSPSGTLTGIEVKTTIRGVITLNPDQIAKDVVVMLSGGTWRANGLPVTGVGYAVTCFGCSALDFRSTALDAALRAARIPVNRCDLNGVCTLQ